MPPPSDLDRVAASARSADHRDGLLELMAAVLLLSLAGTWQFAPAMGGIVALPFIFFGWTAVLRAKERITYPRIGYSAQKAESDPVRPAEYLMAFALMAGVVVAVVAAVGGLSDGFEWQRASALFSGLAFGAGFWALASRSSLFRHRILSFASVAIGTWAWWTGSGLGYGVMARMLLPLGSLALIIGIGSLVVFVRTHPVRES